MWAVAGAGSTSHRKTPGLHVNDAEGFEGSDEGHSIMRVALHSVENRREHVLGP